MIDALRRHLQATTSAPVSLVETHLSWVLLTDGLAYKLKKPVRLPFVDFSSLALRKHFCEEEVRLNKRLAASLYLGVVPVRGTEQAPRLEGAGEPIDYAVCMRRFPPGALFSERLRSGTLRPQDLDKLADRLADFHRDAPVARPGSESDTTRQALEPVRVVMRQLRGADRSTGPDALDHWVDAQERLLSASFLQRRAAGWVRECHGDLHLSNVVLIEGEAWPFDCIEFDPALRVIDVMSEVAFLTMDLKAHGRSDLAHRFLDAYLQRSGDHAGVRLLHFYEVYRALVRALVARLHPATGAPATCPDYLVWATRAAHHPVGPARLMITHGVSGSGKSTVAQALVQVAGAIRLRSDVERKRLFGMTAGERSANPAKVYGADATRRTFEQLAHGARVALQAGYPVIVDAAFLRRSERDAFRDLAAEMRAPFSILHCRADEAQLQARVRARHAAGTDASEADLEVLARQLAHAEPLAADELACTFGVATDRPMDIASLNRRWSMRPLT